MKTLITIFGDFNPRHTANGEIRMMCPFRENHESGADGSKSFFVNQDKGVYNCFSCNSAGSLVELLTIKFKVSTNDALELVVASTIDRLLELEEEDDTSPPEVYLPESVLTWDFPPEYYLMRGFKRETLKHFRIGTYQNENDDTVITIPIYKDTDTKNLLYGVQHTIKDGDKRSFWFKPSGFPRHKIIYNEHAFENATVVEGQSDVWKCYQNERPDAVATFGTKLAKQQIEILKKYKTIRLAYDNDDAGMMATEFAYHVLKHHAEILIVPYLPKDPGKCKKKEWQEAYANATDYAEYHFSMYNTIGEKYDNVVKTTKKNLQKFGIFL